MSVVQRAMVALLSLAGLLILIVVAGIVALPSQPAAAPLAANIALAGPASASVPPAPSAVPATATATASPIPPTPTPTLARPGFNQSAGAKLAPTTFLPGRGPELPGELVFSGRRLDFFVGRNTFSADQVADLAVKGEYALGYMQKRFAVRLSRRVSVGVYSASQAPGRGTRGIAYTGDSTNVRIYYRPGEDTHRALVILSHELGHALQAEAYGKEAQSSADTILLEGLASWISGEYWLSLSGHSSFQARARELYQAGYQSNLATMGSRDSDVAYDMWAGFVEYLTVTYGWDAFNQLYISGAGRAPGSADYRGVYGKSFKQLQDEFYATLR